MGSNVLVSQKWDAVKSFLVGLAKDGLMPSYIYIIIIYLHIYVYILYIYIYMYIFMCYLYATSMSIYSFKKIAFRKQNSTEAHPPGAGRSAEDLRGCPWTVPFVKN